MEMNASNEKNMVVHSVSPMESETIDCAKENKDIARSANINNPTGLMLEENATATRQENLEEVSISERELLKSPTRISVLDTFEVQENEQQNENPADEGKQECSPYKKLEKEIDVHKKDQVALPNAVCSLEIREKGDEAKSAEGLGDWKEANTNEPVSRIHNNNVEEVPYEQEEEPVFDGSEVPEIQANRNLSSRSWNSDPKEQGYAWPEKAIALTNFVRQKSLGAVSTVFRRLSRKSDNVEDITNEDEKIFEDTNKKDEDFSPETLGREISPKSAWNPLSIIGISRDVGEGNKCEQDNSTKNLIEPISMSGRIILYTRLGCNECKETRKYLHRKRLRYVEINIDLYPSRKQELEKIAGSSVVPRVFFNVVLIGGLSELKSLEESGKLAEKIDYVVSESPSYEAPLPPLSGEDDLSSSGVIDELALIARKMKGSICIKDRFYKMSRYVNCFLGSEAVDFLSEDQYLEREEAVEFARKLAAKLFFHHVADESLFEDGNHIYRFLDDDPFISQCQNIPRGLSEVKPKPILEISSRLRFLVLAILEAYTSEDRKHVDYRSIHGSEEFARYLRIVEELQRVELYEMAREEKLSFFVNLYNMMAIHAILVWGHPSGVVERRRFFGDFKYVIGGSTYSLSAIYNGILRGNQRPPYNLNKPFGHKDKRLKVALPYAEPLVHFALVHGTRSGPALRCYSPGNIDKELMEAASEFLRGGGLYVDMIAMVAYVSKILSWYNVDFGKNEMEVLKHAANYLEPPESQTLLELLANAHLKVIYQPYDWRLNH